MNSSILHIRDRLSKHDPALVDIDAPMRAAVALLLQPRPDDVYVFFIHRAHHPHDPWSGHMAFPGGRQDPEDPDLFVTIRRETYEEVGIDLAEHGEYLGRLAEVQASARGKQIGMVVSPFVYLVSRDTSLVLDPVEVQDVIWVPLSFMQQDGVEQIVQRTLQTGSTIQVPALLYGGKTIWGLTYRMLQGFLELITEP